MRCVRRDSLQGVVDAGQRRKARSGRHVQVYPVGRTSSSWVDQEGGPERCRAPGPINSDSRCRMAKFWVVLRAIVVRASKVVAAIDQEFTAVLQRSPNKGGWTYVVWPRSVSFFETR